MTSASISYLLSFKAFSRFLVLMPVLIPFLEDRGLSLAQVFSLTGVYSISCAIFELPTGLIADKWGKKRSLLIGASLFLLAQIGYLRFDQYWPLFMVNVFLGIAASFFSGTDSALLHHYLKGQNRLSEFNKFEGRFYAVSTYSEAAAGLLAGVLASIALYFNSLAQIVAAGIALILLFFLPKDHSTNSSKKEHVSLIKSSKDCLKNNKGLQYFLLLSCLLGTATLALTWFSQAYLKLLSIPLFWYGIAWTSLNALVGFGANFSYRLEQRFSLLKMSLLAAFFIAASHVFMGLSSSIWMLVIIAMAFLLRGIATPALRTLIHQEIPDQIRTAFFSFRSLLIRALYGLAAIGISALTQAYNLRVSLIIFGCSLFLVLLLLNYYYLQQQKKG